MAARQVRARRLLLLAGGVLLLLAAIALGLVATRGDDDQVVNAPTTTSSFTLGTAPGATFPAIVGGGEETSSPAPPVTPGTTLPGETTATPNGNETSGTSPSGSLPVGDDQRLLALSRQMGFTVFALRDPGWQLSQLTSGETAGRGYVAMIYRRGGEYISLSQEPRTGPVGIPNAESVRIGAATAQVVDMGTVVLIGWNAQGTGITFSTDADRARALALAAKVQPVR